MKRDVNILIANPAGNITIFVMDRFPRSEYQNIATRLLAMKELCGEQVAFVAGENKMDMCGLEFCGNASRVFALIIAKESGVKGDASIDVEVSGANEILTVEVNTETNYTRIKMPRPLRVEPLQDTPVSMINGSTLVDFGGIMHIVLKDVIPSRDHFYAIRDYISACYDPPALGVMFYDTRTSKMIPVVYVKDVDSVYFEGSCASGTTAAAIAFASDEKEGSLRFTLPQPAGTITSTVEKENGSVKAVYIEGPVSYTPVFQVKIQC